MMRAGVPHATIARMIGATPEVLLKHYARPTADDLLEASKTIERLFVGGPLQKRADKVAPRRIPNLLNPRHGGKLSKWALQDSNLRPRDYESPALTD